MCFYKGSRRFSNSFLIMFLPSIRVNENEPLLPVFIVLSCVRLKTYTDNFRRSPKAAFLLSHSYGVNTCPVCLDGLAQKDPVIMPCGHVICLVCATNWIERERRCPYCMEDVPDGFKIIPTELIRYNVIIKAQVAHARTESHRKYVHCVQEALPNRTIYGNNGYLCLKAR